MKEETIREEAEKYALRNEGAMYEDKAIKHFTAGFKAALQLNKEEEWISVIDELPEIDTPVLIITTSGVFKVDERFISRFSEDRNPKWRHTDEKYISSWIPLPSPPKVK